MKTPLNRNIFLFAGETSGDRHGANLIEACIPQLEGYTFSGVGGPKMRAQPFQALMPMEKFQVMGFTDVVGSLPKLIRYFYFVRHHILETNPAAVVLIDYTTFNLRMAESLRKKGYRGKIVQYISPSFWAWGKDRRERMIRSLDLLLTIYPFESQAFEGTSLQALYMGNPLREQIAQYAYDPEWTGILGMQKGENLVGLFPGSRRGEIERNLPYFLEAAHLYREEHPDTQFAISCADGTLMELIHQLVHASKLSWRKGVYFIPSTYTYELMRGCQTALATCGTVTLELALHDCPTVVTYKLSLLNRLFAQYILKLNLPHYCMVNILTEKTVFPELIAEGLTPENIATHLKKLSHDPTTRETCLKDCESLQEILPESPSSKKAAAALASLLEKP